MGLAPNLRSPSKLKDWTAVCGFGSNGAIVPRGVSVNFLVRKITAILNANATNVNATVALAHGDISHLGCGNIKMGFYPMICHVLVLI